MKTITTILIITSFLGCAATTSSGSAIRDRISRTSGLAAHNVSIDESSSGIITLNGNVASDKDRNTIENVARDTRGVREVRSNLVVDSSTVTVRDGQIFSSSSNDFEFSQNVRDALRRKTNIDLRSVEITSRDSVVTLRGTQNTNRDIDNLVASTRMVAGVRDVRNELALNSDRYR